MENIKGSVGAIVLVVLAIAIAAFVFISNKGDRNGAPGGDSVLTGSVTYLERIALLPGSVVEVRILDVSRQDVAADVIGETIITTQGENVPIPFSVSYDPTRIDERMTYAMSARILVGGELRWINTDHIPVLTNGNPTSGVEVLVHGVSGSSSDNTSGSVNLEGSTFRLASFNGKEIEQGRNYLLSFEDGSMSAKFCNNMGGNYNIQNGVLNATAFSTLMYCSEPADLMEMESAFSSMLNSGANFSLSNHVLTLTGEGTEMVFTVFMD
jgi:uncharacterized lipoprotein YbaY